MNDQHRGAYTPQQDVPLQFDPRSPSSRRPMPMALIASGALLVVMIAAVAMYYSRGAHGDNGPPRPVGEPVTTLKTAPTTTQPADPTGGFGLDAAQNAPGKTPSFAPPPEQPKPRPVPGATPAPQKLTVQPMSAMDISKSTEANVPAPVSGELRAKEPLPATAPSVVREPAAVPAKPVAPLKAEPVKTAHAKPVSEALAAPAKVAASTSAHAGGVQVQIGAFSSTATAEKGWSDVAALMPGAMHGKSKHVEPVAKDGHTLYRTSVAGFADRASAVAFCDALKAKGKICFVKS